MRTFDDAVSDFVSALFSDSHLRVTVTDVAAALRRDIRAGASIPTTEEVAVLVMGDDDGEVDAGLKARFPNITAFIEDLF